MERVLLQKNLRSKLDCVKEVAYVRAQRQRISSLTEGIYVDHTKRMEIFRLSKFLKQHRELLSSSLSELEEKLLQHTKDKFLLDEQEFLQMAQILPTPAGIDAPLKLSLAHTQLKPSAWAESLGQKNKTQKK